MHKNSLPKLLIVDDSEDIRDSLCHYLGKNGLEALTAASADEAREVLDEHHISLIILDLMMPGEDGLSFCRALMSGPPAARVPVIMLTALHSDESKIRGLDLGADDYVSKPFNPRELLSRIHAVLRRGSLSKPGPTTERRRFAGIFHDPQAQALQLPDGTEVSLTSGENRLLEALLDHRGGVLSREDIAKLISRKGGTTTLRAADNCIFRLRRKLGDNARAPKLLLTDWGGGYRIVDDLSPEG